VVLSPDHSGPSLTATLSCGVRTFLDGANPDAAALVELAVPRLVREEYDSLHDVVPMYLRKSDAEIAWDRRTR